MTVTLAMLNKEMYTVNIVVWHMCHIGFKPKISKSKYKETEPSNLVSVTKQNAPIVVERCELSWNCRLTCVLWLLTNIHTSLFNNIGSKSIRSFSACLYDKLQNQLLRVALGWTNWNNNVRFAGYLRDIQWSMCNTFPATSCLEVDKPVEPIKY